MEIITTPITDLLITKPQVFSDKRGFFMETFRQETFDQLGLDISFVQDNHSFSTYGTLRGLHYQIQHPQGKLVRVVAGEIYDVAVDLREKSSTFGLHFGVVLSADNKKSLWVPPGFAHGFLVLSEQAEFVYKCTDYYAPKFEKTLQWNDPELKIAWPLSDKMPLTLSDKDQAGLPLAQAEIYS